MFLLESYGIQSGVKKNLNFSQSVRTFKAINLDKGKWTVWPSWRWTLELLLALIAIRVTTLPTIPSHLACWHCTMADIPQAMEQFTNKCSDISTEADRHCAMAGICNNQYSYQQKAVQFCLEPAGTQLAQWRKTKKRSFNYEEKQRQRTTWLHASILACHLLLHPTQIYFLESVNPEFSHTKWCKQTRKLKMYIMLLLLLHALFW